jgi:hypothetical protein
VTAFFFYWRLTVRRPTKERTWCDIHTKKNQTYLPRLSFISHNTSSLANVMILDLDFEGCRGFWREWRTSGHNGGMYIQLSRLYMDVEWLNLPIQFQLKKQRNHVCLAQSSNRHSSNPCWVSRNLGRGHVPIPSLSLIQFLSPWWLHQVNWINHSGSLPTQSSTTTNVLLNKRFAIQTRGSGVLPWCL